MFDSGMYIIRYNLPVNIQFQPQAFIKGSREKFDKVIELFFANF